MLLQIAASALQAGLKRGSIHHAQLLLHFEKNVFLLFKLHTKKWLFRSSSHVARSLSTLSIRLQNLKTLLQVDPLPLAGRPQAKGQGMWSHPASQAIHTRWFWFAFAPIALIARGEAYVT